MARPTFEEENVIDGEKTLNRYWNCPIRFIPHNVLDFLQEYDYMQKFKISELPFRKLSERFRCAMNVYETALAEGQNAIDKGGNNA